MMQGMGHLHYEGRWEELALFILKEMATGRTESGLLVSEYGAIGKKRTELSVQFVVTEQEEKLLN